MRADLIGLILLIGTASAGAWISATNHVFNNPDATADAEAHYVTDSGGHVIPCGHYQRIVCGSSIAANVVPELVNANRVVMTTQWFAENATNKFKLEHSQTTSNLDGVEAIMAMHPDLIIVHSLGTRLERIARLREAGIPVLDLGKMLGWSTLRHDIRKIGKVLYQSERAERLLRQTQRRLQQAAAHIPADQRHTAMWLTVYGGKLSGGSAGSSYHDMMRFAGLRDIVAGTVDWGWPSFSVEEVLQYDPDYIITGGGMADQNMADNLRAIPGLSQMRAIRKGNIITVPEGTDSTGPGLVDAAEFLCDAVYGPPPIIESAPLPE